MRNKIITVITIDVHGRDIIECFANSKITDPSDFKWLSQLRFYWGFCPQGQHLAPRCLRMLGRVVGIAGLCKRSHHRTQLAQ